MVLSQWPTTRSPLACKKKPGRQKNGILHIVTVASESQPTIAQPLDVPEGINIHTSTTHSNKPVSGSAAGKRKLSVSGPSVMTGPVRAPPNLHLPIKNSSKMPKQETNSQPPEGAPNNSQ
ncbi:hypothetical protein PGT21_019745 [Puccinia graminis f. sp. tritici]|uniref:Uncharacterized protein n=1 Tax=Puccinia graminis f. sp. tritici TaxID=56615 RepID=A0A5B0NE59_PUCGR|nr:hypothetical protein PGT21_019745 [Puccinia graminis f. sp. tritici]